MTHTYLYGGTRALVYLHARHLTSYVETWKRAVAAGIDLPPTDDDACKSLEAMLRHVLGAARGYMMWMCEVLELEDPAIDTVPPDLADNLDSYVAHLLSRWDGPLQGLTQKEADRRTFPSRWGTPYCIDAMLVHPVLDNSHLESQLVQLTAP